MEPSEALDYVDQIRLAMEVVEMDIERDNYGLAKDHLETAKYKIENALLFISNPENHGEGK